MAYEIPNFVHSFPSGSTLLYQFGVVRLNSAGAVVHTTAVSTGAAAARPIGVTQDAPASSTSSTGRMVSVMIQGITKVYSSSEAVAVGTYLKATSGAPTVNDGGSVSPTSAVTRPAIGIALTSAAASTAPRLISMLLIGPANTA